MHTATELKKIGRNDPCHCGSNLKYKKCCLNKKYIDQIDNKEMIKRIQSQLKEDANSLIGNNDAVDFVEPSKGMIKMSEVIIEFADEFLQKMHTKNQKKRVLDLACIAWNLGVLAEKDGELPNLNEFIDKMEITDTEQIDVLKHILSALINKKLTEYSSIDRLIANYKITDIGRDFRIDIMSNVSGKEISMLKINPALLNKV